MNFCEICGSSHLVERHHIFGAALRKKSEKYNLTIYLCYEHHRHNLTGVHHNAKLMQTIHEIGQKRFMAEQGKTAEEFRREFYKNYL